VPTIRRPDAVLALTLLCFLSAVAVAVPARSEAPPGGSSALTFPQWWSGPGLPGWTPDGAITGGMPWTFAGLTAGAWTLRDPLAPAGAPVPGVAEAQAPLAWYDSAAVAVGEDAAWSGWGSGLVVARGYVRAPGGRKPRAMFSIVSGGDGIDRNAIFINRGDETSWMRGGAVGDKRGGVGDLDVAGDHLWTVAAGSTRGNHAFEAGFTQRGMGESQVTGIPESGRGQSGHLGLRGWIGQDSLTVRLTRGFDSRIGYDLLPSANYGSFLHRDAQENGAEVQLWHRRIAALWGVRLAVRDANVMRELGVPAGLSPRSEWSTRSAWLSARALRPFAGGVLDLQVGGGTDRSAGRSPLVPGASWKLAQGDHSLRLFLERAYVPVWSDLAPGVAPFRQDTWAGGFEAGGGDPRRGTGNLLVLAGRTGARATEWRYPLRGVTEVTGWTRDAAAYRFLLVQGSASRRWRALTGDATGYALARPRSASQPRVDPAVGGKAGLEGRFAVFAGDLGVRLRVEGAYVGARETDTRLAGLDDVTLPGYSSLAFSATITLGDATIVVRGDRLAGDRQSETWLNPNAFPDLVLSRDTGPQWRTELTWPLFN
jgi:hypothetical protein